MWTTFVAAALVLCTAQTEAPPARTTHTIILENGQQLHGFWDQRQVLAGGSVRVELDTPWAPGFEILRESDIRSAGAERTKAREARIVEGWKEAGFTLIDGRPVPTVEVELANRAREMADVGQEEDVPAQSVELLPVVPQPGAPEAVAPEPPSFARRWGGQAAIVVAALLLAGVILKTLVLG